MRTPHPRLCHLSTSLNEHTTNRILCLYSLLETTPTYILRNHTPRPSKKPNPASPTQRARGRLSSLPQATRDNGSRSSCAAAESTFIPQQRRHEQSISISRILIFKRCRLRRCCKAHLAASSSSATRRTSTRKPPTYTYKPPMPTGCRSRVRAILINATHIHTHDFNKDI